MDPKKSVNAADLRDVLSCNKVLLEVLDRAAELALPGWYLAAGCVFQTVWNVRTGRPPTHGIRDYDLMYFDDSDLSWEAEDAVIRSAEFGDAPVEIRNEARVHLWYEKKFGVPCPPYNSTEDAIGTFAAVACCVGVRHRWGRGVAGLRALRPGGHVRPRAAAQSGARPSERVRSQDGSLAARVARAADSAVDLTLPLGTAAEWAASDTRRRPWTC
ncbi:nucleotidyltransferase family protein [Kibdelosporangium philippinense]|uniref:nucleotidyltransferase family protein n=1 Tax=Kibdelosporangium philippinense TaxID=211113 RepID=UPI003FD76DAE